MTVKYLYEYRINKKGAECFRTRSFDEAKSRLDEFNAKRPGVYSMQERSCRLNRVGGLETNYRGEPDWTPWIERRI